MLTTGEQEIARRVAVMTGVDGMAAEAMLLDVKRRGAESPWSPEVGAAARVVFGELAEAFRPVVPMVADLARKVLAAVLPLARQLGEAHRYADRG